MARRSPLALVLLAALAFAALPAFLEPGLTQKAVEMSQTLGQAPIQAPELSSSVALADLSPLENPNITFV
eukprot:CAMPEP_0181437666 /NCGR_PEP_ID=MMETSP1110-20121109/21502_1 /TAXON_ID=174948 /ORGANISM="Symbiodinium sp., Strain CCMP421" /LENGTH=69 /DNA_ID=CAMNT_0023561311 /DNA_START=52 /DNA_END=258 /DNA_ORIENTATION=-